MSATLAPYEEALTRAFHEQRAQVCDLMNAVNEQSGHGLDDLEEDLRNARIVEAMAMHQRQALVYWNLGLHRDAMRELGWALQKGGGA